MLESEFTRIDKEEGFCEIELKEVFSYSRSQEQELKQKLEKINNELQALIAEYKI